jgi:hypothetical protein
MTDPHDERLKKLIERTNEPLPNYGSDGGNRAGKINFEESFSEGREFLSKDLHSDKKSKKGTELDSHRKPFGLSKREEPSKQQTLDAYNFYLKPNIEMKKVKRVLSDSNRGDFLAELNSNSDSNHSSQGARVLFDNGGKQADKIDKYLAVQPAAFGSESKVIKCPEEYSQYILREKCQYAEQLERYQQKIDKLQSIVAQRDHEIKRLRETLDSYQKNIQQHENNRQKICNIILEMESLKQIQKKTELANLRIKLGHMETQTSSSGGGKSETRQFWVDGTEFIQRRKSLEQIEQRRSQLESYKKSVKNTRRLSTGDQTTSSFDETGEDELLYTYLMNGDQKESEKRLGDVIARLNNEEKEIHEQIEKLDSERVKMIQMERLINEEGK